MSKRFYLTVERMKRLEKDRVIGGYVIKRRLGKGGYGHIYCAVSQASGETVALKMEALGQRKTAVEKEIVIFQAIASCTRVPRFLDYKEVDRFKIMCIECLGPSLDIVASRLPKSRYTISTTLRVGIEIIRGLQELNEVGILHRDVKLGNIGIRPTRRCPIVLIDFGLSRPFMENGKRVAPRRRPGFVGTTKYASTNALQGRELSHRDDLLSTLYALAEMIGGSLPWSDVSDRHDCFMEKRSIDPADFFRKFPPQIAYVYELVRRMKPLDVPDYNLLISFFVEAMKVRGCSWSDPFDWERLTNRVIRKYGSVDITAMADEPDIPTGLPPAVMEDLGVYHDEEEDMFEESYMCDLCGCCRSRRKKK